MNKEIFDKDNNLVLSMDDDGIIYYEFPIIMKGAISMPYFCGNTDMITVNGNSMKKISVNFKDYDGNPAYLMYGIPEETASELAPVIQLTITSNTCSINHSGLHVVVDRDSKYFTSGFSGFEFWIINNSSSRKKASVMWTAFLGRQWNIC